LSKQKQEIVLQEVVEALRKTVELLNELIQIERKKN